MDTEHWASIPGYAETYEVSSYGRIRRVLPGGGAVVGRVLSPVLCNGYTRFRLSVDGRYVPIYGHQAVMRAFVGWPETGLVVNHINGVKTDNRLANLEYVTQRANVGHSVSTGLRAYHVTPSESNVNTRKLSASDAVEIRLRYGRGETQTSIARRFGVRQSQVSRIVLRQCWPSAEDAAH